jgi:hypothetical protein
MHRELNLHTPHHNEDLSLEAKDRRSKRVKTYNSGYSLVVTHLTTNPPVRCLSRAERTGSLVFNVLWSYVSYYPPLDYINSNAMIVQAKVAVR